MSAEPKHRLSLGGYCAGCGTDWPCDASALEILNTDLLAVLKAGLIDKFTHRGHTTVYCPQLNDGRLMKDEDPCWACTARAVIARAGVESA